MAVLLETCGHSWLAGFGRLLQITFLFNLPTHCRIPVVLDSIISSAQKYITYKFHKQKFQFRLELIDRKLFLTETFSFGPPIMSFLFNHFSHFCILKSCFPYYLIKNPFIALNYIIWSCSFLWILKSFNHFLSLIRVFSVQQHFMFVLTVVQDSNMTASPCCLRKLLLGVWPSGACADATTGSEWSRVDDSDATAPHCPLSISNSTSQKSWVEKTPTFWKPPQIVLLTRQKWEWKLGSRRERC